MGQELIKMRNFDVIYERLKRIERIEEQRLIIYPFGEIGAITKSILNVCFHVEETAIIDNSLCEEKSGGGVKRIEYLKTLDCTQYRVILASNHDGIYNELYVNLRQYFMPEHIIELFPWNCHAIAGRHSYGPICSQISRFEIRVGSFCSFAEGSMVVGNHDVYISSHEFVSWPDSVLWPEHPGYVPGIEVVKPRKGKETIIGSDVWIGKNAVIMEGVRIGNGAIIGAGAVVTKDIPDYAVAAGVPAKVIKYRYTPEQIDKMLEIAWWNWSDEKIRRVYEDFYLDVDEFIRIHNPQGDIES